MGGGSAVAGVMNKEVGDTAPDLQISAVVPLPVRGGVKSTRY